MTLRRSALTAPPAVRTGVALCLLALAGFGIATSNTEAVVAGGFTAALEAAAPRTGVATPKLDAKVLVSGSEAYWLAEKRRIANEGTVEPATWSAPLAQGVSVGDRITLPAAGKAPRAFDVVAVANVAPTPGTVRVADTAPVQQIAITCRDVVNGELLTFLVPATGASSSGRTL